MKEEIYNHPKELAEAEKSGVIGETFPSKVINPAELEHNKWECETCQENMREF